MEKSVAVVENKHGFEEVQLHYNEANVLNISLVVCDRKDIYRVYEQKPRSIIYDNNHIGDLHGKLVIISTQQLKGLRESIGNLENIAIVRGYRGLYDEELENIKIILRFSRLVNMHSGCVIECYRNLKNRIQCIDLKAIELKCKKWEELKLVTLCRYAIECGMQGSNDLLYLLVMFPYLSEIKACKAFNALYTIKSNLADLDCDYLEQLLYEDDNLFISKHIYINGAVFERIEWLSSKSQIDYGIYGVLQQ